VRQLLAGMLKGVRAEFYAASSREAAVYRGRPFQIEAAIAFGGELPTEDTARVIRFANRVPLLYQQSACSSFKAVVETGWKNYNLQQPRGGPPIGPLVIMIHMASVWVPFTSESKEAIADYDEIRKEMKLALMECGRKLGTYLRKRHAMRREAERRDIFERYIGEIAKAVNAINGTDAKKLYEALLAQARKRTAIADQQLDEEGKRIKSQPEDQEGVIVVESAITGSQNEPRASATGSADTPPIKLSKAEAAMLKVAGMEREDAEPALIDVAPDARPRRKVKDSPPADAQPAGHSKKQNGQSRAAKRSRPSAPNQIAAPTKPRMRLVNGKLIPAEDAPKLFQ
jgi:DNA topoisomerase-6 subunit B